MLSVSNAIKSDRLLLLVIEINIDFNVRAMATGSSYNLEPKVLCDLDNHATQRRCRCRLDDIVSLLRV